MRALPLLLLSVPACTSGMKSTDTSDTSTGLDSADSDADTDTDTDTDADTDADSDTDADTDADTDPGCPAVTDATTTLVVTDIDETLTTLDSEFLQQLADPSHDPEMRPDANTLMQAYFDLGYRIIYLTARGDDLLLLDGTSATDATTNWLSDHGFPFEPDDVFLADGWFSTDPGAYKAGVIADLVGQGRTVEWAYGNATTDMEGYQDGGTIANDHVFLVGSLSDTAGDYGVNPISDDDAYTNHFASFMSSVPCGG